MKYLRKINRERKSYIYEKQLLARSNTARLKALKTHINQNKQLPKDLQDKQLALDLKYNEAHIQQENAIDSIDDEFWDVGINEPRVLITTSRDPSIKLTQFAKELKLIIPNSQRINRGGQVIKSLVQACQSNKITDRCLKLLQIGKKQRLKNSKEPSI